MNEKLVTAKGGTYPMRRPEPPSTAYFEAEHPPAGEDTFGLELGGLRIEIAQLPRELAQALRTRFHPYSDDGAPEPCALRALVSKDERDYFIEPPQRPEFNPVGIACDGPTVRYVGYRLAGWFEVAGPRAGIVLARGDYEPALRAFENWIRTAVAWRAAASGGALVHAASSIRNGRAYLFFGESGAGKSTLSASTQRATVISDDLSLVLPNRDGELELIGTPFRGTYEDGDPVVGRFPLAAAFRIVQAKEAAVVAVPRIVALGQLIGNLTFVAEAFAVRPDLFASVERAFSKITLAHLRFRKDDSYWDAIDAAGL